uniref:DNA polymerase delta subunit 3 n=1 Tax=Globodera pallida TaxID=36090 RepID=A0A183C8N5_GLOPA
MNLVNDWKQKVRSEKRAVKTASSLPKLEPDKKAVPVFHQPTSIAGPKGKQAVVKSETTTTMALQSAAANHPAPAEKPKMPAKAKIRLSKPRLTGLEGDDEEEEKAAKMQAEKGGGKTTPAQSGSSVFESPLTRILSATDKFHAQNRGAVQPKRKSVEVMFSDNFMDSLCGPSEEASATAPTKKPKIIRKKLSETVKPNSKRDSLEDKDYQHQQLGGGQSAVGAFGNKKRVRFSDEFGIELTQTRFFEIEEGERVNVSKMHLSREEIKHFDSHQEKLTLQQHHSFGAFSLTDPTLMPPGHRLQQPQISPQQQHWGGAATSGFGQMAKFGKEETLYRWKMSPLDETFCLVVPGSKSQAKNIEATRIRGVMEAICLPEM